MIRLIALLATFVLGVSFASAQVVLPAPKDNRMSVLTSGNGVGVSYARYYTGSTWGSASVDERSLAIEAQHRQRLLRSITVFPAVGVEGRMMYVLDRSVTDRIEYNDKLKVRPFVGLTLENRQLGGLSFAWNVKVYAWSGKFRRWRGGLGLSYTF